MDLAIVLELRLDLLLDLVLVSMLVLVGGNLQDK